MASALDAGLRPKHSTYESVLLPRRYHWETSIRPATHSFAENLEAPGSEAPHPELKSMKLDYLSIAQHSIVAAYLRSNFDTIVHFSLLAHEVVNSRVMVPRLFIITDSGLYRIPQSAADTGIFFDARIPLQSLSQILVKEGEGSASLVQYKGLQAGSGEKLLLTLHFEDEARMKESTLILVHLLPNLPILKKVQMDNRWYDMPFVDTKVTRTKNAATSLSVTSPLNIRPPLSLLEERRNMSSEAIIEEAGGRTAAMPGKGPCLPPPLAMDDVTPEDVDDVLRQPPLIEEVDPLPHHSYMPGDGGERSPRYRDGTLRILGGTPRPLVQPVTTGRSNWKGEAAQGRKSRTEKEAEEERREAERILREAETRHALHRRVEEEAEAQRAERVRMRQRMAESREGVGYERELQHGLRELRRRHKELKERHERWNRECEQDTREAHTHRRARVLHESSLPPHSPSSRPGARHVSPRRCGRSPLRVDRTVQFRAEALRDTPAAAKGVSPVHRDSLREQHKTERRALRSEVSMRCDHELGGKVSDRLVLGDDLYHSFIEWRDQCLLAKPSEATSAAWPRSPHSPSDDLLSTPVPPVPPSSPLGFPPEGYSTPCSSSPCQSATPRAPGLLAMMRRRVVHLEGLQSQGKCTMQTVARARHLLNTVVCEAGGPPPARSETQGRTKLMSPKVLPSAQEVLQTVETPPASSTVESREGEGEAGGREEEEEKEGEGVSQVGEEPPPGYHIPTEDELREHEEIAER